MTSDLAALVATAIFAVVGGGLIIWYVVTDWQERR
jgi:hypothetical protein